MECDERRRGKAVDAPGLPIASTLGYVTATQAPNGVIHVVTSRSKLVLLHIELNEVWVRNGGSAAPAADPKAGSLLDGKGSFIDADGHGP